MTKRSSSNSGEKASSTSGNFVVPTPKCNDYLLHEYRKWEIPDLTNLKHDRDSGINAAYYYIAGVRRLSDPEQPGIPRRIWYMLFITFLLGIGVCFYAFKI